MPFPGLPNIASGGGAIPITGGAATSGPATAIGGRFAPVNIAGLFGDAGTGTNSPLVPVLAIAGVAVLAFVLFKRR